MTYPNDDYNRPNNSYDYGGRDGYVGVSIAVALVLAAMVGFLFWNSGGTSQQSANSEIPTSSSTVRPPAGLAPGNAAQPLNPRPPLNSRPNG